MKSIISYLFILGNVLCTCYAFSQVQNNTDSLLMLVKNAKEDTASIELLISTGRDIEAKQPKTAITMYRKALYISIKIKNPEKQIRSLDNMGYLYKNSLSMYDSAEYCYGVCVRLAKENYGEKHPDYALCLNNHAALYESKSRYSEAEELYVKALNIRKEVLGTESSPYAMSLNNLAALYNKMGNYILAEKYMNEATLIFSKVYGENNAKYATSVNNLAIFYKTMGNFSAAEPLYIKSMNIRKEIQGTNHPDYAMSLNNLAGLYFSTGNYPLAEHYYSEAKKIYLEAYGEKHPDYAMTLNNMATLYDAMGNDAMAEEYFVKAKEIYREVFGKSHQAYANALNNLAIHYESEKKYAEAEKMLLEALQIRKEVLGEKHIDYNGSVVNMAYYYWLTEKYYDAENLYIQALNFYKETFGTKHPDYARTLNYLANLYKKTGEYPKAEQLYKESVQVRKEILGDRHPDYAVSVNNLALLYYLTGNMESAEPLFLEGMGIINNSVIRNFVFLSEKEKEMYFKTRAGNYAAFYEFASDRKEKNPGITEYVFDNIIRTKGLLLKSSTAMRSAVLGSNDSLLTDKYNRWIGLRKDIDKLYRTEISKRKKNVDELEKQANELEKELVKGSQVFSDFEKLQNHTWRDVQKGLGKGEAAVEFINFSKGKDGDSVCYYALVIVPGAEFPEMIRLFEEKELVDLLKSSGNKASVLYGKKSETAKKLYSLVWLPLEKTLQNSKTVYVSPSGWLHKISFSALLKNNETYLCDVFDIREQTSTAKTATPENFSPGKNTSAMIFGGLKYNTPDSKEELWPYLEGTRTEADNIKKLLDKQLGKVVLFTDTSGSEANFKQLAQQCNLLHISTHGFFYPEPGITQSENESGEVKFRGVRGYGLWQFVNNKNPLMRSGLVFSGANQVWNDDVFIGCEDGMLTAEEVAVMDLRKCDLVVLSACETGLGDIKGSEGVYGLQRAFKMAGVKYIIMSLWQVPDKETVEFMETFYTKLLKLKDVRKAFNETQKAMRKKYDPYYWAAFVLVE